VGQAETERKFIGVSGKRIRDFTPSLADIPSFIPQLFNLCVCVCLCVCVAPLKGAHGRHTILQKGKP